MNSNDIDAMFIEFRMIREQVCELKEMVARILRDINKRKLKRKSRASACPHKNLEWHEVELCIDCGEIIDQCT